MNAYYTIGGYKTHYSQDGKRTLCGRDVSNGAGNTLDMCKACIKAEAKITEHAERTAYAARAAEMQDDVMHAAPVEPTTDDSPVTLSRPMQTTGDPIPWGAEHVWTHSADWTRGMSHGAFKLYRFDETAAYGDLGDGIKWYATSEFSGSTPTLLYAGASQGDAMMACARAHWAHARTVARNTETVPGVRVSAILHGEVTVNFLGDNAVWLDAPSDATHVIHFVGDDETMCGEPVRQTSGTLRVSVDPSDATCPDCTTEEATLAALDDAPEPSDDECHRAALLAALDVAEDRLSSLNRAHDRAQDTRAYTTVASGAETPALDALTVAMGKAHGYQPANLRPGGMVHVPGLSEAACVPMLPTLVLNQTGDGRILARVGGHEREFNDSPALRMHVAFWAHTVGFKPSKGRAFKWVRSGKIIAAPAATI